MFFRQAGEQESGEVEKTILDALGIQLGYEGVEQVLTKVEFAVGRVNE